MKVTFELPNGTVCVSCSFVYDTAQGMSLGNKMASTDDLRKGKPIVFKEENKDE